MSTSKHCSSMTGVLEGAINLAEKVTGKDIDGDGYVAGTGCPVSKPRTGGCPFRNTAFTMPIYPALNPEKLPTQAQHGVLGQLAPTSCSEGYQLDGTWVNAPGE